MTTVITILAQIREEHWTSIETLIWVIALLIVLVVGSFAIRKICTKSIQQELKPEELLRKFRDSHTKGELDDQEFRKIKSMLAGQIGDELKDKDNKG
ncbi:MAG: hypothetical protein PVH19_09360 [Planctomycetia bacterium]|jgi:uncharacterized membrane protein